MAIDDSELDRILDQVEKRKPFPGAKRGAMLKEVLADHGLMLLEVEKYEDLKRQEGAYNDALHTPRDRGGLSAT